MVKILLAVCAGLALTAPDIHAKEISETLGQEIYSNDAVTSFDFTEVAGCHPKDKALTIRHRRQRGSAGFESTIRLVMGDTFVVYDKNGKPQVGELLGVDGCTGIFFVPSN